MAIDDKIRDEKLQYDINREAAKIKVHSSFTDNICGADLADMQLFRKFNKRIRLLLCVIDIFSKYA